VLDRRGAILGPGLPGWEASRAMLAGTQPWEMGEAVAPPPACSLPPSGGRTGLTTRFALAVATEASAAEPDRAALETVFASGNGDGTVVGAMLDALHVPEGAISPTQFSTRCTTPPRLLAHRGGSTRPRLAWAGTTRVLGRAAAGGGGRRDPRRADAALRLRHALAAARWTPRPHPPFPSPPALVLRPPPAPARGRCWRLATPLEPAERRRRRRAGRAGDRQPGRRAPCPCCGRWRARPRPCTSPLQCDAGWSCG
jgi:hypothetical protein